MKSVSPLPIPLSAHSKNACRSIGGMASSRRIRSRFLATIAPSCTSCQNGSTRKWRSLSVLIILRCGSIPRTYRRRLRFISWRRIFRIRRRMQLSAWKRLLLRLNTLRLNNPFHILRQQRRNKRIVRRNLVHHILLRRREQ